MARTLQSRGFLHFAHQRIFEALTDLCIHQGKPADPVTLADYLNEKNLIADIGGHAYLVDLWDAAPTLGNAEHYAQIIRQKSIVRNLIHACTRDSERGPRSEPARRGIARYRPRDASSKSPSSASAITPDTLQEAIDEAYDRLDARKQHGTSSGIPTGYVDLDSLTAGLQNDELVVIAARPSVGKTSFALNVVRHVVVEEGTPVLFVSLEQSRIEIGRAAFVLPGTGRQPQGAARGT